MSIRIGEVNPQLTENDAVVHVAASRAGVELHSDQAFTLEPTQARNYAALLVRAADEVERMRSRGEDGVGRGGRGGDAHVGSGRAIGGRGGDGANGGGGGGGGGGNGGNGGDGGAGG